MTMTSALRPILLVLIVVGLSLQARAEEQDWLERYFARPPPEDLVTGKQGLLRWVGLVGDRRLASEESITSMALSTRGGWVGCALGLDGVVALWELETGREIRRMKLADGSAPKLAAAPDGTWFVSASKVIKRWDALTGRLVGTYEAMDMHGVSDVLVSPDQRWIVAGSFGAVRIWDVETGKLVRKIPCHVINSLRISADGSKILAASGRSLVIWDAHTGAVLHRLDRKAVIECMAASRDGRWILTGAADLTLWDATTGKLLRTITGTKLTHPVHVIQEFGNRANKAVSAAIAPDGTWFVTGHIDGSLVVRDAKSGVQRHHLKAHGHAV